MISGKRSSEVLTKEGFLSYTRAVGYSSECFGQHARGKERANCGDGNGWLGQRVRNSSPFNFRFVNDAYRKSSGSILFSIPVLGTSLESLIGGARVCLSFFRDDSKALSISREQGVFTVYNIIPGGYNIGG